MGTQNFRTSIGKIPAHQQKIPARVTKSEQTISAQINTTNKPLKDCVFSAMKNYYTHLDGSHPSAIYEMVLAQVEPPLLVTTLEFAGNNQSKAALLLGISRGTLRKKLKQYGID